MDQTYLAAIVLLVLFIIIQDAPGLVKGRCYKDLVVFSLFLLAGIYLAMVQLYHWPLYNPLLQWAEHLSGP